jgi:hypothetical protein
VEDGQTKIILLGEVEERMFLYHKDPGDGDAWLVLLTPTTDGTFNLDTYSSSQQRAQAQGLA